MPSATDERGAEIDEGALRNTWLALLTQLSTAVFTAILTLFLVRALGPRDFGVFSLAVGLGGILMLPADLGVSNSAARFVAEHRGDRLAVAAVMRDALTLKLATAVVISVALVAGAQPIADAYDEPDMTWPLRGVGLAVLGQSVMMLYTTAFVAARNVSRNLRLVASESAVEATASIGLVLLGAGTAGATFGRGIGYAAGASLAILLAARLFGRSAAAVSFRRRSRMRQLAGYAAPLFVIDAAFALLSQVDVLLIGAILGTASVGIFSAPLRLIAFLAYPSSALAAGVAPRVAAGRRAGERDVGMFVAGLRWLIVVQAAAIVPLVAWPEPIVDLLLGAGYGESAEVLRAFAPFVFLNGLALLLSVTANYLGQAIRRIPIALAALAVNVAVDLALLREIGVIAGAVGTAAAYLVYVPGHFWLCRRALDLPTRPIAVTLVRSLLAAAAAAAAMLAIGTGSPPELLAGAVAGAVAFGGFLIASREITRAEIAALRALARRRRGGGR